MRIAPHARAVAFSDYAVLHNLESGAWVKISKGYYEQLILRLGPELKSDFGSQPDDFPEFLDHLVNGGYLVEGEETQAEAKPVVNLQLAYMHLCDACNLRCKTCYFGPADKATFISEEVATNAVRLLSESGARVLVLSGGEPLLHPYVTDIARLAKKSGLHVTIITNGLLLTRDKARHFAGLVDSVQVSVDGLEPQHDQIRGPGTYQRALKAASNAKEAGLNVFLTTTITRLNAGSGTEILKRADEMGFKQTFSLFMPTGLGRTNAGLLMPSASQLLEFVPELLARCGGHGLPEPIALRSRSSCGVGERLISIDPDGSIYPCHLIRHPDFRMGMIDMVDGSLSQVLERSPVLERLHSRTVDSDPECSSCRIRYFCAGGCSANKVLHGNATDPHCAWYGPLYSAAVECMSKSRSSSEALDLMRQHIHAGKADGR